MDLKIFWTHWVIGICAATIWAWGDRLGVASTLQTYAAYTLPLLIGHAVGKSMIDKPAPPAVTPDVTTLPVVPTIPVVQDQPPVA